MLGSADLRLDLQRDARAAVREYLQLRAERVRLTLDVRQERDAERVRTMTWQDTFSTEPNDHQLVGHEAIRWQDGRRALLVERVDEGRDVPPVVVVVKAVLVRVERSGEQRLQLLRAPLGDAKAAKVCGGYDVARLRHLLPQLVERDPPVLRGREHDALQLD
eukprot:6899402-Prymnesium_polylepis.1